jgi:hypothetical protein
LKRFTMLSTGSTSSMRDRPCAGLEVQQAAQRRELLELVVHQLRVVLERLVVAALRTACCKLVDRLRD